MVLDDDILAELGRHFAESRKAVGCQFHLFFITALGPGVDPDRVASQFFRGPQPATMVFDCLHPFFLVGISQPSLPVNQFFKTEVDDPKYMTELKQRCSDQGVQSLLIMVDGEGRLGDPNEKKRMKAVENHRRWLRGRERTGMPLDPGQRRVPGQL